MLCRLLRTHSTSSCSASDELTEWIQEQMTDSFHSKRYGWNRLENLSQAWCCRGRPSHPYLIEDEETASFKTSLQLENTTH